MINMRIIDTLIISLLLFTSVQAQKVELSMNLKVGERYGQTSESKISINQVVNGQALDIGMVVRGGMTFLVLSANKEEYEMEMMYEHLSMKIDHPKGAMEFDSEKAHGDDIMSTILSSITMKPIGIVMTRAGIVSEVSDMDSIWTHVFEEFSKVPEDQINQARGQINEAYGSAALKANIEMVTAIFPDHRVGVGDEWTVNTTMEAGMTVNVTTTYKLEEIQADFYVITGDSKLQTADKEAIVDANGMSMKYDLSGVLLSRIRLNRESGWIIEGKSTQDIKGNAYVQASPTMPMAMTIPMTMKNETVITGK